MSFEMDVTVVKELMEKNTDTRNCIVCGKSFECPTWSKKKSCSIQCHNNRKDTRHVYRKAWNKGLDKSDPRVAKYAASQTGKVPSEATRKIWSERPNCARARRA